MINKNIINQIRASRALHFKLFSSLCLLNYHKILFYLFVKNLFKFFFDGSFNGEKAPRNFIIVTKFNRKNIYAVFGKTINRLFTNFYPRKTFIHLNYFYFKGANK